MTQITTADRTSSIEYWCLSTVATVIRSLAAANVFSGIGINPIRPQSVVMRYNRRPRQDGRTTQSPERNFPLPGIICTYLGHTRPVNAGENTVEDGVIQILVSMVDAGDDGDETNMPNYLRWQNRIRGALQEKTSTELSPLEQCPLKLGQVYLVHVTEHAPADETDWSGSEHFRSGMLITCYTRTARTIQ